MNKLEQIIVKVGIISGLTIIAAVVATVLIKYTMEFSNWILK